MCDSSRLRRSTRIRGCEDVKPDLLVRSFIRCSERLKLNPVKIEPDGSDSEADNSCDQPSSSSSSIASFTKAEKLPAVEVVIEIDPPMPDHGTGSGLTPATVGDFIEKLAEKEQAIIKLADDKEQLERKAHSEVANLKKEVMSLKQRLSSGAKRPKLAATTPTSLSYSAKMAARISKTQKDKVAAACSDVPSDSSSEESESEPEDDPYDEAFTGGKSLPRGIWEHGRMNAFGTRPRQKCAKAKETSRKSGPGTRSRPACQKPDAATSSTSHASSSTSKSSAVPHRAGSRVSRAAAAAGLPQHPATAAGGLARKSAAGLPAKSTTPSVPADAPTQRFQEFLIGKNLVDDYLEYSTTISTSRKDFLRDHDLLQEWVAFNP